jgi:hypothetical protein
MPRKARLEAPGGILHHVGSFARVSNSSLLHCLSGDQPFSLFSH